MEYTLRPFTQEDLGQMHRTFLEAFADYSVPFQLTRAQFERRMLDKTQLNFDLSVGVWSGEKLVGFLFNAVGEYKGRRVAYNGGTGVIPGHRGERLTEKMYQFLKPRLMAANVEACLLEVITSNHSAIKAYERVGFKRTNYYYCYRLHHLKLRKLKSDGFEVKVADTPDWDAYPQLDTVATSFQDTWDHVRKNPNEVVLEVRMRGQVCGYAVFQPHNGRISRMAVLAEKRGKGIGYAMAQKILELSENENLTVLNIPRTAAECHRFMQHLGFENQIDQYEMMVSLDQLLADSK